MATGQQVPQAKASAEASLPEVYVRPCLELVHGATSRLDDLCNSILAFLKITCFIGETVELPYYDGDTKPAVVKALRPGQAPNVADKEYVVEVDGVDVPVHITGMFRDNAGLTKAALKAWLNSVARQQSLGVKGMTCVWLVRPDLLERYGIPDALPQHVADHLARTAKRREQRQRAKARAKAVQEEAARRAATASTAPAGLTVAPGLSPEQVLQQQMVLMQAQSLLAQARANGESGAAAASSGVAPTPTSPEEHKAFFLQQLVRAGASHEQLFQAALQLQLNVAPLPGAPPAPTHEAAAAAAVAVAAAVAAVAGQPPAVAATLQAAVPFEVQAPPEAPAEPPVEAPVDALLRRSSSGAVPPVRADTSMETLDETEARLEPGSLRQAIFAVLRAAGPVGLSIADLLDGVRPYGFEWGANARAGKSSISSTCGHDHAFLRLGPGRYTLRALPGALENVDASAAYSRQELEAAKAVSTIDARAAAAQAKLDEVSGAPDKRPHKRNVFKCGKCMRVHHAVGSALALCDTCPKAWHVACLDKAYKELPQGDWACPKCVEKREASERKLQKLKAQKKNALERVAAAERDREERGKRRQLRERESRAKQTGNGGSGEGEGGGGAAAAGGGGHGVDSAADDAEVVVETAMEVARLKDELARWRAAAEAGGDTDVAEAEAEVVTQRIAAHERLLRGPPEPRWVASGARDAALLYDALAIVEFVGAMSEVLGTLRLSLSTLQRALADPLTDDTLPALYCALLRVCLLEVVQLEAPYKRSRAKRWARVLDSCTWPEVLRRYLLASRSTVPVPGDSAAAAEDRVAEPRAAGADAGALLAATPDEVAVHTALWLGRRAWWELGSVMLVRTLGVLCDDVLQGARVRAELAVRAESLAQLVQERAHAQAEDRKREKEAGRQRRERLQAIRDLEARAAADKLADEAKPTAEELDAARAERVQLKASEDEERRGVASRSAARDAEIAAACAAKATRGEVLGCDRHHRRYIRLRHAAAALWIIAPDCSRVGVLEEPDDIAALPSALMPSADRERQLRQALEASGDTIREEVEAARDALVDTPWVSAPAVLPPGVAVSGAGVALAAGLRCASGHLVTLLNTCSRLDLAPEDCAELRDAAASVQTVSDLVQVLRRVEVVIGRVSEGLPRDAGDEAMRGEVADADLYRAEFLLAPTPGAPTRGGVGIATAGAAADDTAAEEGAGESHALGAATDLATVSGGEQTGGAATSQPHSATPTPAGTPAPPSERANGIAASAGADFAARRIPLAAAMPHAASVVVTDLEELDDTDAERECKSGSTYDEHGNRFPNKPLRLWRTPHDRATWLKDLRRAERAGCLASACFCASTILDRSHPMTIRLANIRRVAQTRSTEDECAAGHPASEEVLPARSTKRVAAAAAAVEDASTASKRSRAASAVDVRSGEAGSMALPASGFTTPLGGQRHNVKMSPIDVEHSRAVGAMAPGNLPTSRSTSTAPPSRTPDGGPSCGGPRANRASGHMPWVAHGIGGVGDVGGGVNVDVGADSSSATESL